MLQSPPSRARVLRGGTGKRGGHTPIPLLHAPFQSFPRVAVAMGGRLLAAGRRFYLKLIFPLEEDAAGPPRTLGLRGGGQAACNKSTSLSPSNSPGCRAYTAGHTGHKELSVAALGEHKAEGESGRPPSQCQYDSQGGEEHSGTLMRGGGAHCWTVYWGGLISCAWSVVSL